ncbi:MAG TPA: cupin-like domain-containing protein [Roseomonas sp.]
MLTRSSPAPIHTRWSTVDPIEESRRELHKQAFAAQHPLAGHPLFSIEALTKVAEDAAKRKDDIYVDVGDLSLADKWGTTPKPDMTIPQIIDRIETAGAWLVLKHVEANPAYKMLLDEYEAFVRDIAGPEGSRLLHNAEMLVFITSPRRKTPYHFDAEINFLVQIQGSKDLWVCDPMDRNVTTEEEIEQYYTVSISAGTYKPHAETVARQFTLHPGDAVHIPTHGAHWVQNHDEVSVSLSLNMEFPRSRYADVYRANHYLRRLGLSPRPPGGSAFIDRSKAAAMNSLRQVKSLVRR